MGLNPASDVILEVARAADPTRAAAVTQRLDALGSAPVGTDFANVLDRTAGAVTPSPVQAPRPPDLRARLTTGVDAPDKASKAETQFESVMLNAFINELLPKEAPDAFGQGLSGQMWRSLLAEKIANQIAGSGALGLGSRLFATHPFPKSAALGSVKNVDEAKPSAPAQASANALSAASGEDIEQGSFLFGKVGAT